MRWDAMGEGGCLRIQGRWGGKGEGRWGKVGGGRDLVRLAGGGGRGYEAGARVQGGGRCCGCVAAGLDGRADCVDGEIGERLEGR